MKSDSNDDIIEKTEATDENEGSIRIRNGSERNGSENSEEQVSRVESRSGQAESRGKAATVADKAAARLVNEGREVKVSDLGILGGSADSTVIVVDKSKETALMKKARKSAEARGLKVTFFVGNNLSIRDKNGKMISVRAYISSNGKQVFVRADHSVYTAEQLMRHELGHDKIHSKEFEVQDVVERLEELVGKENIDAIAEHYEEAYAGSDMTAEEIWEECICDSLGDMNIFSADSAIGLFADLMLPKIKAAAESESKAPTQTRGSPEGKASRETSNKKPKYISYSKVGQANVEYINRELRKLYSGIRDGIADGIAITNGNTVFIIDSGKENGKIAFGVRKIYTMSDEHFRTEYVRGTNYDALSEGYVSNELSERLRSRYDNDWGSGLRRESGAELQVNIGKSEDKQSGVSGENADNRGLNGKASREIYWYPKLSQSEWNLLNSKLNKEIETSDNFIDKATKWLYADVKGVKVFAIYGIGNGTEATILYAVGGKSAEILSLWRDKYESGIDRTKRNAYRRHLEHIGVEQNQHVDSADRNSKNNISGERKSFDRVGRISSGTQRRNNRGTVSRDSEKGKASRELDIEDIGDNNYTEEEYNNFGWARENFIRSQNNDTISKGHVSDELSERIGSRDDSGRTSNLRRESGAELQTDIGKSEDKQGGISGENADNRGLSDNKMLNSPSETDLKSFNGKASRETEDLYTATDDFVREVAPVDRHSFARSLANKTSGMTDGEVRTVYIWSTSKVYVFEADGYMHGEIINSFIPDNAHNLEEITNGYDKINKSSKNAYLRAENVRGGEGRRSSNSGVFGRRRSNSADSLHKNSSERNTTGDIERIGQTSQTEEEIDEIVKNLREMYGLESASEENKGKASRELDIQDIGDNNYTEEQYNNFGWARENEVLSAMENERLRSLFADAVSKQANPPRTKSGEYMIAIGEDVDNKIAYMTGDIDNPVITRVLEIDEYNETKLDEIRRNIYAFERSGIQRQAGDLFTLYTAANFGNNVNAERSGLQISRYNDQLRAERGRGSKTAPRVKEILFDDEGNEISRKYSRELNSEKDYNNFGWVRDNNVISAGYWRNFTENFSQAVTNLQKYPKNKNGEYMISAYDVYGNSEVADVVVFAKGTIESPDVSKIVKIKFDDESEIYPKRRNLYEAERRGLRSPFGELFDIYYKIDYSNGFRKQRNGTESVENNNQLGVKRGGSEVKTNPITKFNVNEDENTITYTYANGDAFTESLGKYSRELDFIDYINENSDVEEYKPISNRTLLANALESATQNEIELKKLTAYKKNISFIEAEEAKLNANRAEAKTLNYVKPLGMTTKVSA